MESYPLYWPSTLPRNKTQIASRFDTKLPAALENVKNSLELFGKDSGQKIQEIIISSNFTLGQQKPKDAGVAIWFKWENEQRCIAVDRYLKIEDNIQAIYHVIEARRTELRHGGLHIARQTFVGFKALPEKAGDRNCWQILGIIPYTGEAGINAAFRKLSTEAHPDTPNGDEEKFKELTNARDQAFKLIGK